MVRSQLGAVRGVLTPVGVLKSESKACVTGRVSTHQVSLCLSPLNLCFCCLVLWVFQKIFFAEIQ